MPSIAHKAIKIALKAWREGEGEGEKDRGWGNTVQLVKTFFAQ